MLFRVFTALLAFATLYLISFSFQPSLSIISSKQLICLLSYALIFSFPISRFPPFLSTHVYFIFFKFIYEYPVQWYSSLIFLVPYSRPSLFCVISIWLSGNCRLRRWYYRWFSCPLFCIFVSIVLPRNLHKFWTPLVISSISALSPYLQYVLL